MGLRSRFKRKDKAVTAASSLPNDIPFMRKLIDKVMTVLILVAVGSLLFLCFSFWEMLYYVERLLLVWVS